MCLSVCFCPSVCPPLSLFCISLSVCYLLFPPPFSPVIIPKLHQVAVENNVASNLTRRRDVALVLLDCYRNIAECCIPTPHTRTKFFIVCTVFVRVFLDQCVCVSYFCVPAGVRHAARSGESERRSGGQPAQQSGEYIHTLNQCPFLCT